MIPIYFTHKVPGYEGPITEWTAICHSKDPFIVIDHNRIRHIGRWGAATRARKFAVTRWVQTRAGFHHSTSYYGSLEAAEKAASKMAKETT